MSTMRLALDPIDPIRKTRLVPLPADRAFELFTAGLDRWWPLGTHSVAESADVRVRFEGRIGGRVMEVRPDGSECAWADVIAWDPPHRFVLAWHPTVTPVAASIIDVRFTPLDGARCELVMEHRGWEEHGADGAGLRAGYDPGWDAVLGLFEAEAGVMTTVAGGEPELPA